MPGLPIPLRPRRQASGSLIEQLANKVVGQPQALAQIVPYLQMHRAGLAPEGRPAGVFLLLGPTGTGKTRTVEALAEVLHGSEKSVLKVDCGEFQLEHEVAKLIGAPPGYLGHRETQPLLTQQKLNAVTSENSATRRDQTASCETGSSMMRRLTIADYTLFPYFGRPALAVRWRSCHHEGPLVYRLRSRRAMGGSSGGGFWHRR